MTVEDAVVTLPSSPLIPLLIAPPAPLPTEVNSPTLPVSALAMPLYWLTMPLTPLLILLVMPLGTAAPVFCATCSRPACCPSMAALSFAVASCTACSGLSADRMLSASPSGIAMPASLAASTASLKAVVVSSVRTSPLVSTMVIRSSKAFCSPCHSSAVDAIPSRPSPSASWIPAS